MEINQADFPCYMIENPRKKTSAFVKTRQAKVTSLGVALKGKIKQKI